MIRMIAACARNRVMGTGGTLPWNLTKDWDYFLETTRGGALLMGRICYEDFVEYARCRKVVVLSRNPEFFVEHGQQAPDLLKGLALAKGLAKDVWICGGEQIYQECMNIAEELYLTLIDSDFEGDAHFPEWKEHFPRQISRKDATCDGYRLSFLVLGK